MVVNFKYLLKRGVYYVHIRIKFWSVNVVSNNQEKKAGKTKFNVKKNKSKKKKNIQKAKTTKKIF